MDVLDTSGLATLRDILKSIFSSKVNVDDLFVSALNYGLKNDGVTDNLALFNQMVEENPGKTIYFGAGVYCFSGTIEVEKAYLILDNAELKLAAATEIDYFVKVTGYMPDGTEFPQDDMFIRGNGTINANLNAKTAVGIGTQKTMLLHGIKITGFTKYGIYNGYPGCAGYCYELNANNLLIYNEEILDGTIGIAAGSDSTFRDITTLNAQTAIKVSGGGNIFSNIHSWCFDFTYANKESLEGTCFADISGGNNRFSDCYVDTYQYGFKLSGRCDHVMITNLFWWNNSETWPTGVRPVVFTPNPTEGITSQFYVVNARLPSSHGAKFSEEALDSSTFYNVYSDMANAVNNSGGSGGSGDPTISKDLGMNGYSIVGLDALSFWNRSGNWHSYIGQAYRAGSDILTIRVAEWDSRTNVDRAAVITNIATPELDTDAANKGYVDAAIAALESRLST